MGRFTKDETDLMIKLYKEGLTYVQISKLMDRNKSVIGNKLKSLGVAQNNTRNSVSLWSVKEVRKYIVDIEEAKKLTSKSNKKINVTCPECKVIKEIQVSKLTERGMSCICNSGKKYPELFFIAYVTIKQLSFVSEVSKLYKNYRFDFVDYENKIIVETHGIQHYDKKQSWYERTHKSDIAKRKWCKENGYTLIELDCRKSSFEFIRNSIEQSILPDITDNEVSQIVEYIHLNKKYDVKSIIEDYASGLSTTNIGDKHGITHKTVSKILRNVNIKLRSQGEQSRKMIRCIETNQIFNSIQEAGQFMKLSESSISGCIRGRLPSAGKNPSTKDVLHWEFVSEQEVRLNEKIKTMKETEISLDTNLSLFKI